MTPLHRIKLLGLDIDGVLTDGHLLWGGETIGWTQRYWVRDGEAIVGAGRQGLQVTPISRNKTLCAKVRIQGLGLDTTHVGTSDKVASLMSLCAQHKIRPDEVCYVGDGAEDVPIFEQVGLSIAPADGHPHALSKAHRVTQAIGGRGVAEEVIGWILAARAKAAGP